MFGISWRAERISNPIIIYYVLGQFCSLAPGNAVWRRGMQFGAGGCSLAPGDAVWRRGMQFGAGGYSLAPGDAVWRRGSPTYKLIQVENLTYKLHRSP